MDQPTLILGVDPGLSGAWALYDFKAQALVRVERMPLDKDGKARNHIDPAWLGFRIDVDRHRIAYALIEEVNAMPRKGKDGPVKMGAQSSFRFGYAAGIVAGCLGAMQIRTKLVPSAVWKAQMGLTRSKDLSRLRATQLFPLHAATFKPKNSDGLAEAALIAKFGERFLKVYGIT